MTAYRLTEPYYSINMRQFIINRAVRLVNTPKGSKEKALKFLAKRESWIYPSEYQAAIRRIEAASSTA
jgi:hypothetical protein